MKSGRPLPGMLFHALHRAHQKAVQARMSAAGLDDLGAPPLLFLLRRRSEEGRAVSQRELADDLHISPATAAVSLKSLERGGYVEKHPDPEDQRCKRVTITTKGIRAVEQCFTIFKQVDGLMFTGFSREEYRQLNQYHQRMLCNLWGPGHGLPDDLFDERMEQDPCSKN